MNFLIKSYFLFLLLSSNSFNAIGQIQFVPILKNQNLEIEKNYFFQNQNENIKIETFQFYISNIEFYQDDRLVSSLEKKHHLIDLENVESLNFDLESNQNLVFNKIKFNLGVDSLTSVSGVFGGDLDPTKGMYWTWQSGYINFKLEGIADSCPARKNKFQFHLGGYSFPNNSLQKIELPISNTEQIKIKIVLDDFFHKINLKETYQIMSPSQQAVETAQLVASIFSISE